MKKLNTLFSSIRKGKKLLFTTAMMMSVTGFVQAQTDIANYPFTKSVGTYTPITGGTVVASGGYDNDISAAVNLGGTFTYGGAAFTTCYISANGFITFGAAPSGTNYTPLSTLGSTTGAISAFGQDAGGSTVTGAAPEISYLNIGGATGEFVVQFKDHANYYNRSSERMNFQIRLNLATNAINIVYGNCTLAGTSTNGITAHTGIRGNSTTYASNVNNLMIDNIPSGTTCNWGDAVTGYANSSSMLYSFSTNPNVSIPNGLTFTWTPATGPAPIRTFSAVTNITSSGATVSWTAPTGATQYNVQYRIPGTCAWTSFSGNPVTGTTATLSGLATATTYQVRVQASNGTQASIWSHIPSSTGTANGYSTSGTFTTSCAAPTPGATLVSATNVCSGNNITLSLTTPGAGLTYQWQSSANNVTFTDINGATAATLTTPATANYYRCAVTCAAGPSTVNSTPVQVTYANNITATTPGVRCGIGTVSLAATGSAGTTVRWYTAATGGSALASGSPFTTPSISATTSYYAGAENIAAGQVSVGQGASTGSGVSYSPLQGGYGGMKTQFLYTAAELTAAGLSAGNITSLALDITGAGSALSGFNIQIGTTTLTDLTTPVTIQGGLNDAYSTATFTPVVGINTFNLSTPFNWNGTSNIIVSFSWSNNNTSNTSSTVRYDATTNYASQSYRKDSETSANMLAFTGSTGTGTSTFDRAQSRAKVIFGGQAVCSSPRVAVTATVNTPPVFTVTDSLTVCNNAVTALNVTSAVASYNTYTWSPATNLYTNAAATTPYVAGASAATVYLKSATAGAVAYIATASNTTTLCVASDTSTTIILPGAVTAEATPSALCNSGTATLMLNPASGYGAGGFQWQSSTNNTTFNNVTGATNATYTTPVTTSNVYYRANIKNSAGAVCLNTTSDTVRVYVPTVTTSTGASRCGPGVLNLSAAGTDGSLSWYAAATGGTALASGNTFATPSLTATTTYYVAAEALVPGTATVGAGASTTVSSTSSADKISPFDHYYGGFKSQNLITAAELVASGLKPGPISSVAFDVVAGGGLFKGFNMSIGHTTQNTLTTTAVATLTPVYTSTTPAGLTTPASGLCVINFATPFVWNGTSNIVIETCWSNNNTGGTGTTVKYDATSYVSHNYYQSDSQTPSTICGSTSMSTGSNRPKMVINGITVCSSTPRTPVIATINTIPDAVITPATGPVQVCQGSTTTLTATGGGNYQWRNATGNIAGAQSSSFTTGTAGTYSVVVTTPATGCSDTSNAVAINVNPLPNVFIGNDTAICADYTLVLNAGNAGATYLWDNGTTNQTRSVTTAGTYSVKVTNTNNCVKTDTIHVTVNPLPIVNLGNDTAFCEGNTLTLNAGNPGAHYHWNNGTTNQTLNVNTTGNYSVTVTDNNACKASDNINILVKSGPVGTINAVYGDTSTYTFNVLNAQFVQEYTWNFGDGSPLATGPVVQHRYTRNGIYIVSLVLGGECNDNANRSVSVDVFDAGGTGIVKIDNPNDLVLYPNPAKEQLTIENKSGLKLIHITAYNILGQVVYNKKAESPDKHQMVISGIAPGIYTLKVETDKGFAIRKFEILK